MHFFLNKGGWDSKHGWFKSFEARMLDFAKSLCAQHPSPVNAYSRLLKPHKWTPNMGSTTRIVQQSQPIKR